MTPSLFDGTEAGDEYGLAQTPGGKEKIERHHVTFIAEEDFEWMAKNGINAVRIPVGYWIFDGDGPFMPCIQYLDFAVEMAEKYKLRVLIDLHGAKGSQNGNDHSGKSGRKDWFTNEGYRKETIDVLARLAQRYKDSPALWGIELLNEPKLGPRRILTLRTFYQEAYERLSGIVRPGTHIVFSDGFVPWLFTGTIRAKDEYPVAMDIHWYQFGRTILRLYFANLKRRRESIRRFERQQSVIIGEWSGMLSHITLRGLSREVCDVLQHEHVIRQLAAYESAAGWFYWTYKTEGGGIWSFRSLVERGVISLDRQSATLKK